MTDYAWVEMIDETEADADLAAAYEQCADPITGRAANINEDPQP